METYSIRDLKFRYPKGKQNALDGIDLDVGRGDFVVLCGPSGCGKSTLLRQLKSSLAPYGDKEGSILFEGEVLETVDTRTQSARIGFVQQDPDNQIVTDKVWHELARGLESLGEDTPSIRRKVAEMASFFGITDWFYRETNELSGGQKQLLNLAAVMVMHPSVLILDEPSAQLDPIAASDFLAMLGKINRELGTTVILTEHRLEETFPLANRVVVMKAGRIRCQGSPDEVGRALREDGDAMFLAMPAAMRIWSAAGCEGECPVTVRDGRRWIDGYAAAHGLQALSPEAEERCGSEDVIAIREVYFKYDKKGKDVLRKLDLQVKKGSFTALLGGNGTGKTTTLKLICGLLKPYRGSVSVQGALAMLPQDPKTLFVKNTVEEELSEMFGRQLTAMEREAVCGMAKTCRIETLLDRHPYDLSGGEQQRVALAKVLLSSPDVLLLDEPTKGLDADFKRELAEILQELLQQGKTILMVSHDVEFCASHAGRCALFFDGGIAAESRPRAFFSGNNFYTTSSNRIAREHEPVAVTAEDVIEICTGRRPQPPEKKELPAEDVPETEASPALRNAGPATRPAVRRTSLKAKVLSAVSLSLVPFTLWFGTMGETQRYYLTALAVLLECMVPFFAVFEGRKPKARELVTIAVMCAIGVAGRAAFFMLPSFKPVMAIVIITGIALGAETGFLTGAVIMLISNIMFSQGPWTPWQMFTMGLIGFAAGHAFRSGLLPKRRPVIAVFGAVCAIVIYGGIMNPASALMWLKDMNWKILLSYYATGFPVDCVHALATFVFLMLGAEPMLEKLERIKEKYGML